MPSEKQKSVKNADHCRVVGATHDGNSAILGDLNTTKTGRITITAVSYTHLAV